MRLPALLRYPRRMDWLIRLIEAAAAGLIAGLGVHQTGADPSTAVSVGVAAAIGKMLPTNVVPTPKKGGL